MWYGNTRWRPDEENEKRSVGGGGKSAASTASFRRCVAQWERKGREVKVTTGGSAEWGEEKRALCRPLSSSFLPVFGVLPPRSFLLLFIIIFEVQLPSTLLSALPFVFLRKRRTRRRPRRQGRYHDIGSTIAISRPWGHDDLSMPHILADLFSAMLWGGKTGGKRGKAEGDGGGHSWSAGCGRKGGGALRQGGGG